MTLASAALVPASPSEDDTNEDILAPPPNLIVLVDFRKGLVGQAYYPYSKLIDWGSTYNFVSQSVVDKL
jgi:hypothetical protein